MYNSHDLAIKIKTIAKERGIPIKDMLVTLKLGSNTMSSLYHGKSIAFDSLAQIADYLNCSVDYLLGRTDSPNGTYSINGNNNVQVNGHNGDHSPLTVNNTLQLDEMERNLIEAFRMLDFPEKIEAISGLIKKAQKKAPSKDGDN